MGLRGYGLPTQPGYSPYQRAYDVTDTGPRDSYEHTREYSVHNLSLSDYQDPEDMPSWNASSKKSAPRGYSSRSPGNKHQELKKPSVTPARNQNPGIDTALRNLDHEIRASLKTFQALVQCFETQIEPLRRWAEGYTLDMVWRNMVMDKVRPQRGRERFEGVATRFRDTRGTIKEAVKNAKALKEASDDKYKIERQIRTAKKAILYSDGIIDLVNRAAGERQACKQLVYELEEARVLLDDKKHRWIYGEDMPELQSGDLKQLKTTKGDKPERNGTRLGNAEDGSADERPNEPACSLDNPRDLPQEEGGKNHGGKTW